MDKKYILDHVEDLDAQQLAQCIAEEVVTLQDLKDTEMLDASKRRAIQKILVEAARPDSAEEQSWEAAKAAHTIEAVKQFIDKYPGGHYKQDANELLYDLQWEAAKYANTKDAIIRFLAEFPDGSHTQEANSCLNRFLVIESTRQREREDIINNLKADTNHYSPSEIIDFLDKNTISKDDLMYECGIPESAIYNIKNIIKPELELGKTPDSIPDGFTEVYFWGYPGSGKTCALGAILQMAEKLGYLNIAPGPGANYATKLMNVFSDDDQANDYLPAPSPVEVTQYLPFSLKKPEEKGTRSVSLIELSGEIFKCFYLKNTQMDFSTAQQQSTFESLQNFLASKNRKIHFFFVDCSRSNKRDTDGLTQANYLSSAATYFQTHKIFSKATDAIFIVLTKSDLLRDEYGEPITEYSKLVEASKEFLINSNYSSFINTLKDCCKSNSINGGKLTFEPFTLGQVYFQDICNFEGTSAKRIIDILMDRIPAQKKSFMNYFNQ